MSNFHKKLTFLSPPVAISFGDPDFLPRICAESSHRIALIADAAIAPTYGKELERQLQATLFSFEGGEVAKTREIKQSLEDDLLKKNFGRDTLLVALGGGTTLDLAAFLASTYMRGIPFILVPTTLLAMVDAAIGGKTGVNTQFGKNLIGTFSHPIAISIDLKFLTTLPDREWRNGFAEILKYGLIAHRSHWEDCEEHSAHWKQPAALTRLILSSIQAKMEIVEKDPLEKGMRRILNFGHTVAHALEKISRYQIPHGEAVAIGCQAESALSYHLGYLPQQELERILKLYRNSDFPHNLPHAFSAKDFLEALQWDKKSKGKTPRFVLIDQIGHSLPFDGDYCRPVSRTDLNVLTEWLECRM